MIHFLPSSLLSSFQHFGDEFRAVRGVIDRFPIDLHSLFVAVFAEPGAPAGA
jgi:hypothetical protein